MKKTIRTISVLLALLCIAVAADGGAKEVLRQEYTWPAVAPGGKNQEVRHEFAAGSEGAFETSVVTLSGRTPYWRIEWRGAGKSRWSNLGRMRPRFFVDPGDTLAVHILQVGSETRFRVTVIFHPKQGAPASWFASRNFQATGTENHRVREHLLQLQSYFTLIDEQLRAGSFDLAKKNVAHLEDQVKRLQDDLEVLKSQDGAFQCAITMTGLPSDGAIANLAALKSLEAKWLEMGNLARGNQVEISRLLVSSTDIFSANIVKSVIKNYLNWSNSIPSSPEQILTLLGPAAQLAPWDLPRGAKGWLDDAEKDSSILNDQVRTIQMLKELQAFYEKRRDDADRETKAFHAAVAASGPEECEAVHRRLKAFFSSQPHLKSR